MRGYNFIITYLALPKFVLLTIFEIFPTFLSFIPAREISVFSSFSFAPFEDINFKMGLENLGVRIGKEIKVISKQPYGPITIEIDQHQIAIGRGMANKIYVEI